MVAVSPAQRRPRRTQLTLEAVVEAAARVMARDGYAGLTMRAIADALGVRAPALYWYVPNKEALEVALYDHLMADFVIVVSGDDWREQVRQAARQLRAYMRTRRDISRVAPHGFSMGPNTVSQLEGGTGILLGAGLSPKEAAYGFNMLYGYVLNWVEAEADWRERQAAGERRVDERPVFDPAAYPNLAITGAWFFNDDPEGRFEFGLDCMIAGLETRIGR
jgi:TetR/AcrR family tetracycline transcriptional repressor